MDPVEIIQLVARLRRVFSRQPDVLCACAELERLAAADAKRIALRAIVETDGRFLGPARAEPVATSAPPPAGPKRDRAAYMRDYRKRRKA